MSELGTGRPLEIRLRIWDEDATRFQILGDTGTEIASGEAPTRFANEAHAAWERARSTWTSDPATLREVGAALTALVPASIAAALQETIGRGLAEGRPIRVRIDGEGSDLRDVPWEWLFLRPTSPFEPAEGPLALVPNVRAWRESPKPTVLDGAALRVLLVASDPGSPRFPRLPWLSTETRTIGSTFALSRRRGVELRTITEALPSTLEHEIAGFRPQILHFAGHGEARPGGGVLVLNGPRPNTDRLLPAALLATWLADAGTQLAFLSACDTAGTEGSVARALLSGGVPTVVGMQTPIPDAAQPHFARVFYGSLLGGASVDEAVAEARQASGSASSAWASAVLYASRTPFALFAPYRYAGGARVPNNLPLYDAPIVGRDAEIEGILRLTRDSRLVVLTGPGGIGKTRLAMESAALATSDFPEGVYGVECDACASAEDVLYAIARALGVERDGRPLAECVAERLHERRTLLVLDGFEGVVSSREQGVVERLLGLTSLSLLVTSRFRLGLEGEAVFDVLPLDGNRAHGLELIVQNAGWGGRKLTTEEERSLVDVCRSLEGVPLALVIAAGRLRFLQADQLADLLRESALSTLGGGKSGVGAAIRRSLDLIPEEDRRLLHDLAVFAGAFSWDDVAQVYPDDRFEMLEGLARLVDRSLLMPENAGDRRYRVLGSLREYMTALSRPDDERERASRGREAHLRLFAGRAKKIGALLDQGRWVEGTGALWDALPNLRAALDFAKGEGRAGEAETLCRSLARTLMEAGMWNDFERVAAAGYTVAERDGRPRLAAYLMSLEGAVRSKRGDYDGAEAIWRRRVDLCRSIGFSEATADALLDLAAQDVEVGRLDRAREWIERASEESLEDDGIDLRPVLATVRCRYYDALDDRERASAYAAEAEALIGPATSADQTLFVYTNLARVWRQRGDHRRVRRAMGGILKDAVAGERRIQAAIALTELAKSLEKEGDARLAARCLATAATIFRELGSHRLRGVERQLEEFQGAGTDPPDEAADGRSWGAQIDSILDYLSEMASDDIFPDPDRSP